MKKLVLILVVALLAGCGSSGSSSNESGYRVFNPPPGTIFLNNSSGLRAQSAHHIVMDNYSGIKQ